MAQGLGLILVAAVILGVESARLPWWQIKIAQEQGPNACVVEEIPGTNRRYWTECRFWVNRKICGQKAVMRYECCEGFQRVPGQNGCTGVKPLKNLLETARDLGATSFVDYVESSGLTPELTKEGAFTLFAPTNEAFEDIAREQKQRLDANRGNPRNPILLYHMADQKFTSKQFRANLVVETRYNGHKLRINKYSSAMETVNCVPIVRKDQQATNGVVHLVDGLLDPVFSVDRELAEIVMQDGRFSELAKAMEQSGFINRLRNSDSPFTIFAPSDEAFQKLPASRREKIMADNTARNALLENHVVHHPMCLPAIIGEHRVRTIGTDKITLDCDKSGTTVETKRLRSDFILASNGVLYMIDDVLLPNRAKSVFQLLEQERLWAFLSLVRTAGLADAMDNFGDYTLFVPSEAAMYSLPAGVLDDLKSSREKARKFVLYHATQGKIRTNKITDNQVVTSLDEENSLRLLVYRKALGVENAIVEKSDIEGMNGCIHVINKALFHVNESAGDILRKNGNFSLFLRAMEKVMASSPDALDLHKAGVSYTFFAPNDQAFQRLGGTRLSRIMDDTAYLTKTIKNHMMETMMASEAFKPDLVYDIQTRQNGVEVIRKNGKLKVNDALVTESDIINTNGIIHVINKVLLPDQNVRG